MANLFVNLPASAGNGVGAAVVTSGMGSQKTITVEDTFTGSVVIEISLDGGATWGQVATFTDVGKQVISFAAERMRVRRTGIVPEIPGLPNIDVASDDIGGLFAALAVPAGNGSGAPTNVAAFGQFNTVNVSGVFTGAVKIQISEDGTDWADCFTFTVADTASKTFTAQFMRVTRKDVDPTVPGLPIVSFGAINDAGSGAASSAAMSNCFIYKPGSGDIGPVVFDDWADLMTALGTARAAANGDGCYNIEIDDSITTPAVIPAGGPYDLTNVTLVGRIRQGGSNLQLADGATFTQMRSFSQGLSVLNLNTVTPADSSLINGDGVLIDTGVTLQTTLGGQPIWSGSGLAPGEQLIFVILEFSSLNAFGPIIDLPVAGSLLFSIVGEGCLIDDGTVTGVIGTLFGFIQTVPSAQVSQVLTGFAGTVLQLDTDGPLAKLFTTPYLSTATANAGVSKGNILLADTSGGAFIQDTPSISGGPTYRDPGSFFAATEVVGRGGLQVQPQGGDTIDGQTGSVPVPPGGTALFLCDGISNWIPVAGGRDWYVGSVTIGPAVATMIFGAVNRVDPTGGVITANLPAISSGNAGFSVVVKNSSGSANNIAVTPAGADTIDGAAVFNIGLARASITCVSDGVSNWEII